MTSTYQKPKLPTISSTFVGISVLYFCTGFVLARAVLFNQVLPVAISFAVALFVSKKNMLGAIGAFCSYLLLLDISTGTRFATCVLVLCALIYFAKANQYISTACVMFACAMLRLISSGFSTNTLAFCIIDISLAIVSLYLFEIFFQKDHPQNHIATGFLVIFTAFSLTTFSLTFALIFSAIYIVAFAPKIPSLLLVYTKPEVVETTDKTDVLTSQTKQIINKISTTILDSIDHVAQVTHDDVYMVYNRARDSVCQNCKTHDDCWVSNHIYTMDCLNSATTKLIDKSHFKSTDFPLHFSSKCTNFSTFLQAINSGLFDLTQSFEIHNQIQDSKRAISAHYTAVSAVLDDITTAINQPVDRYPSLEQQITAFVSKLAEKPKILAYSNYTGLLFIEIEIPDTKDVVFDTQKLCENLSELCEKPLDFVSQVNHLDSTKFLIKQRDKFSLEICTFLHSKQQKSGDIVSNFNTNDGFNHLILSDAMGSGISANAESKQVVNLLENLLKSGVSVAKSIKTVSPICSIKNEQLNFVALDLLSIDLNTLEGSIVKYGASPTYIARDGKIYKISSKNLPLGLSNKAEISRFRLAVGDLILVSSDGLNTANDTYIRHILRNGSNYSCAQIKEQILQNEIATPDDDKTAVVIRICANN